MKATKKEKKKAAATELPWHCLWKHDWGKGEWKRLKSNSHTAAFSVADVAFSSSFSRHRKFNAQINRDPSSWFTKCWGFIHSCFFLLVETFILFKIFHCRCISHRNDVKHLQKKKRKNNSNNAINHMLASWKSHKSSNKFICFRFFSSFSFFYSVLFCSTNADALCLQFKREKQKKKKCRGATRKVIIQRQQREMRRSLFFFFVVTTLRQLGWKC